MAIPPPVFDPKRKEFTAPGAVPRRDRPSGHILTPSNHLPIPILPARKDGCYRSRIPEDREE